MPRRRQVGLAAALASSAILGTALPTFAAHADGTTVYVNNGQGSNCSDSGAGSQAQPFCTVQAAANAAQPGQTVQVGPGAYPEQVTVTHSGTPGNPITFTGGRDLQHVGAVVGVPAGNLNAKNLPHAFVLSGVHDVTVTGFSLRAPQEAVLVADSARTVLDGSYSAGAGMAGTAYPSMTPAVRLTGTTTATTISRNRILSSGAAGVAVDAGVSGTTVTTNAIGRTNGAAVAVTDAPGTAVTSNSILIGCHSAITLDGNSANSTIENNVITDVDNNPCAGQPSLAVSAGSTSGTKADYNDLSPATAGRARYAWGADSYPSLDTFRTATQQGAHDVAETMNGSFGPVESGATDSADANAPGELATDMDGNPRVDDPNVRNTGTGVGYYDRGAFELQDQLGMTMYQVSSDDHLGANIYVGFSGNWGPVTATLDFGDGSPKARVTGALTTVSHGYPRAAAYTATLTVTDAHVTRTTTATVVVQPAAAPVPYLSSYQPDPTVPQMTFHQTGSGPFPLASYVLDFGDGSPKSEVTSSSDPAPVTHQYPGQGSYTATYTVTDDHGGTATSTYLIRVGVVLPLNRTIEAVQDGQVSEIYNDDQHWYDSVLVTETPAGELQPIHASTLAFSYSPAGVRVIEAVENGVLHEIYAGNGWQDNPIQGAGGNISSLSFSYSPSGARVIEAIEGGVLHEIYSAADGWHDNPIDGVAPNVTAMTFSYSPSGARVIEAIEGGVLHEIYSAADGWHDNPIQGVAPDVTALSFTYNPAGQRVIEAVEGGVLHEVYSDWDGWHDAAVPGAGAFISNLSVKVRPTGDRVIEAVEHNEAHEIYTNGSAWMDSVLPNTLPNVTAVSLALR